MQDIATWRLNVLRAAYLIVLVGLGALVWPVFIARGAALGHMHGVVCAMLCAVSLLAAAGLRYPLRMLPILLFELAWKSLWLAVVGLPLLLADAPLSPAFAGTVTDNLFGLVVLPLFIPWDYVWSHYVVLPGDRWRSVRSPS